MSLVYSGSRTARLWLGLASLCLVVMLSGCQTTHGQTTGQYIDDSAITSAVKAKLTADRVANLTRVEVETTNGTVHLLGIVDTNDQKSRATQLASQVDGVKHVDNDLQVARR